MLLLGVGPLIAGHHLLRGLFLDTDTPISTLRGNAVQCSHLVSQGVEGYNTVQYDVPFGHLGHPEGAAIRGCSRGYIDRGHWELCSLRTMAWSAIPWHHRA